jgi:hypothetical protein
MQPIKLPKQRQKEHEETREQEQEHLMGHTHPRCLQGVE